MDLRRSLRCRCCGRRLKNPASIAVGIGPVCATYYGQFDFFDLFSPLTKPPEESSGKDETSYPAAPDS
jgi:hypothetical protein